MRPQAYALPKGLSLYDFARGDLSNTGQNEIVSLTRSDYINIYNQKAKLPGRATKPMAETGCF